MAERWTRYRLTAELLADAHFGSGSGGSGIDALAARDRYGRPVIWASHVEGVLRDAERRLRGNQAAEAFFGRAGGDYARGDRQRAVFTSLYATDHPESHIWRSTAREAFDNRAPKDDTLRVVEHVPRGTKFVGEVELPESDLSALRRLVQEVDALGSGRSAGAGRLKLWLEEVREALPRNVGTPSDRLVLLLKNRDPLCITATATPDNLIPSVPFVPGRGLLGAIADWLIAEDHRDVASLLTAGRVSVSDALPLPEAPADLASAEVLPAPLALKSEKPRAPAGPIPWWALPKAGVRRVDALSGEAEQGAKPGTKFKRPEPELLVYRGAPTDSWTAFCPSLRVRLRNGRPDPKQAKPLLFAIEQIVEETYFLAELRGSREDVRMLAEKLVPVLDGRRWLRVGRGGTPVEVVNFQWVGEPKLAQVATIARLTLTSDLLALDELMRWRTALDGAALRALVDVEDLRLEKSLQDSVMVHGFNGTSRLWRMPAAAIRRGSVFAISGAGVARLAERAASGQWLGERTHEGFGRFRLDAVLPGVANEVRTNSEYTPIPGANEEAIAAETQRWLKDHESLAKPGGSNDRKPSLSQWFDLVADLERQDPGAIQSRLNPTTAGGKNWKHKDAEAIVKKLEALPPADRAPHARFFVRWLRARARADARKEAS